MSKCLSHICQSITLRSGRVKTCQHFFLYQRCLSGISSRISFVPNLYVSKHQEDNNNKGEGNRNDARSTYSLQAAISLVSVGVAFLASDITKKHRASCSVIEKSKDDPEQDHHTVEKISLAEAIEVAKDLCQCVKDENGSPGLSVAVSIDGKEVWSDAFGYADLENRVRCHADTVMRIASISKSITMTVVAKLWEAGQLDLDKPVRHYVPSWPEKMYEGKKVDITTRQLVSHLAGVRHYDKSCGKKKKREKNNKKSSEENDDKVDVERPNRKHDDGDNSRKKVRARRDDEEREFYLKRRFVNVRTALNIFKDDELCSVPGTEYLYTTHGWTLISAVVEAAAKKKFPVIMRNLFMDLGMDNTYLDETNTLIYNRARHYLKNKQGKIINAPYVDLSCKWAGGGIISTVKDLVHFGNMMLYSYQYDPKQDNPLPEGYLKSKTVNMLWTPNKLTKCDWDPDGYYGMGWAVVTPGGQKHGQCREVTKYFSHTGSAVGGTSVLIILPRKEKVTDNDLSDSEPPHGIVVSIISNLGSCRGLSKTALRIAKLFNNVIHDAL